MKEQDHIAVFTAHPDDEGAVWATLYKHFEEENRVSIIWSTYGDKFIAPVKKYVHFLPLLIKATYSKKVRKELSEHIKIIRKTEALRVAKLINAIPYFLEFNDMQVPDKTNQEAIHKVTKLIREIKPSIILTHWFREMHRDHKNTAALALKSYLLANKSDYMTETPPHKVRIFGFWDERGKGFRPNFYLNVSKQIDRIKELGKCYESQQFRIVGRFAKFNARRHSKKTPYKFVERFKIFGKKRLRKFGEFFP
ncbi:MAG TPA: PIG-L family deacetylase [Candidatus Deferrimicrobium sp.]|nr:PIG-L family deacetylase [Candidatus Deferrimicrobium sp.]